MPIANSYRQRCGQALNSLALTLSQPFHRTSEGCMRAVCMPILPGKEGNCSSKFLERCKRTFQVAICILTLPPALVGAGLNFVASYIKHNDYFYIKGGASEKKAEAPFKFMTYNACLTWGGFPMRFGGLRAARHRINGIATMILNKDPDILVMQETSFGPGRKLMQKLKHDYAHFFTKIGTNPLGQDSFFFIASKYKILKCGFIPFPGLNEIKRGLFWMETPRFHVLHSHLQYGSGDKADNQRAAQLKVITRQMKELQKKKDKPCFLLGDLNLGVGYQREGYKKSGLEEYFVNPYPKKYPGPLNAHTTTCTNLFEAKAIGAKSPELPYEIDDYTLLDKNHSKEFTLDVKQCAVNWKSKKKALSDHKALLLTATQ